MSGKSFAGFKDFPRRLSRPGREEAIAVGRSKSRETIQKEEREALLNNLKARGLDSPIYTERANDYVSFRKIMDDLKADIEKNGTVTKDLKSGDIVPRKSVSELAKVSRELGKIYQELAFTELAKKKQAEEPEEDEL